MTRISISEIFRSLQGEGVYSGIPMTFIRFQGCNLLTPCRWCDTSYAQNGSKGQLMSVSDIAAEVSRLSPYYLGWICITGGEPLFQLEGLEELVRALKKGNYRLEIETNGTIPRPGWYTLVDSWVVDIKCPSSGVPFETFYEEWVPSREQDQIKMVVDDTEDLSFAEDMIYKFREYHPTFLISPTYNAWLDTDRKSLKKEVAQFCIEHRVRLSLQLHKLIWDQYERGV